MSYWRAYKYYSEREKKIFWNGVWVGQLIPTIIFFIVLVV